MTEYYNDILCIEVSWLTGNDGVMTTSNFKQLKRRSHINQLRTGGNGRTALVEYSSIPQRFKDKIIEKIGDPRKIAKYQEFRKHLHQPKDAISFFANYKLENGGFLPTSKAKEYCNNAMFLNALNEVSNDVVSRRKAMGGKKTGIWDSLSTVVNSLRDEYGHTLPANAVRLKDRYRRYMSEGYQSLIHRSYGNQNSRKVNESIEKLILSLYILNNKPYVSMVGDMYLQFLAGQIDVIDINTGEIFNRHDFYNSKGQPIVVSDATIWNYVNDPKNRIIVDSTRNDRHTWNNMHRPHHHRHSPNFSLSKISMDDRDLPRKMLNGKRVKAYYAYDVTSGCVVGASYSKDKNTALFIDCMRDMFRFLDKNGFGFPSEVEVEHHIVSQFKNDLMKSGVIFPFVRFAGATNSQEKRAEHLHRAKKYGYEKRYQDGIGRFYARLEANKTRQELIWYEDGRIETKEKKYEYDRLVADDLFVIDMYNNDLHPNQKKYPGMTRMDVLKANINPELVEYERPLVARYVGDKTKTTIRRSQYVQVQYEKYQIPGYESMAALSPNDKSVTAYYLPNDDNSISEVYLFQDDEYICEATKINKYNEAIAEQTDQDREEYTKQAKYVKKFDTGIKEAREKLSKLQIIENTNYVAPEKVEEHIPAKKDEWDIDLEDYSSDAVESL